MDFSRSTVASKFFRRSPPLLSWLMRFGLASVLGSDVLTVYGSGADGAEFDLRFFDTCGHIAIISEEEMYGLRIQKQPMN